MTSAPIVTQIRDVGAGAQRDVALDMRKVRGNLRSALQHSEPERRQSSLVLSLVALQAAATSEIAKALAEASWVSLEAALVSWSRATLYWGSLATTAQSPIEGVYAVAIAHLLTSSSECRGSARRMRTHWLSAVEPSSADILAFLPPELYPTDCRVAASSATLELRAAIEAGDAAGVARAASRVARRHSRGGGHRLEPPISWVPLPLLLGRAHARAAGLPWVDPPDPLWNLWQAFCPQRRRRPLQPIESQLVLLVDSLSGHTESIRAELRQQIVLGEVLGREQTQDSDDRR